MLQLNRSALLKLCSLSLLAAPCAWASVLCATVMDYAQLPLPTVSLTIINLTTGKAYQGRTDKSGVACVANLPEGPYSVEASLAGFLHVKYFPVHVVTANKQNLRFWLPFAELSEGGITEDSSISGTLSWHGSTLPFAEVCLSRQTSRTCTTTNDLGEYALVVAAAEYEAEVRSNKGTIFRSSIDLSTPGVYRNRIVLKEDKGR